MKQKLKTMEKLHFLPIDIKQNPSHGGKPTLRGKTSSESNLRDEFFYAEILPPIVRDDDFSDFDKTPHTSASAFVTVFFRKAR